MFHVQLLHTLDLFGTVVFAASGALMARQQQRNALYAMLYASITALGGGTLRDVLLSQQPVFWMRSPGYLWLASMVGLFTFTLTQFKRLNPEQLWLADAISLATFAIVGTHVTLLSSHAGFSFPFHWIVPLLMGLVTGAGGGLMRDVIGGETPYVLEHPSYAIAALAASGVYGVLMSFHGLEHWAIGSAIAIPLFILPTPAQGILNLRPPS